MRELLLSLWFLLPAGFANMAPVITAPLPGLRRWSQPIDGGRTWGGTPILGPHKTWRGLISGLVVATAVLWLQQETVGHFHWAGAIVTGYPYRQLPVLLLGPLLGLGALGGDALESFFKRRNGRASGAAWVPFDQLDYVVGAIVASLPFIIFPLRIYVLMLVVWFALHVVVSYGGYLVGLKERPI